LSSVVTIITLIVSIPAGKALGALNFKGKRFFKMLLLAPIIVPPVVVAMGIHVAFIKVGLANTFWGVVLVHLVPCVPYAVRILMNIFEITGESMEMQARVLGARPIQVFFNITLPLIAPGLLSAGSLVFIISFSQYFLTFLIGGGRVITFSMLMFPYIQSGDRMMASVYSLAFILTTLVILLIMEKFVKDLYKADTHFYL
jgi:putative spermidine/putrescine transport system permease protein